MVDIAEMERKLETGWDWMKANPRHPKLQPFWEKWEALLAEYSRVTGLGDPDQDDDPLPEPSPWIEEMREQLILGGIADVEPRKERLQS